MLAPLNPPAGKAGACEVWIVRAAKKMCKWPPGLMGRMGDVIRYPCYIVLTAYVVNTLHISGWILYMLHGGWMV